LPNDFPRAWQAGLKIRIGLPRKYFYEELDPAVEQAMDEALRVLRQFASEEHEIVLDPLTDRTLQAAEAYAFHAKSAEETPQLYQPETLRRILTGAAITPEDCEHARIMLQSSRAAIAKAFEAVDVIVTPTTPVLAPTIRELREHPDQLRPSELTLLRNTRPFNVWGIPAISVPCGFTEAGLPIGLQIAATSGRDELVLQVASLYEQATEWHKRRPHVKAPQETGVLHSAG
jgi:Asp-tRNA(Asn)/Glu-tRNA(Gln) amidotransferase A subunit family amidase